MADTRIGAGLSTAGETVAAFNEAAQAARRQLGQHDVDLSILFASRSHLDEIEEGLAAVTAILDPGAVGALLRDVDVLPCVSQGAAPIGPEMVVTAADRNVVLELASKPALAKLAEVIAEMGERERALAATGLLVGIVIDENKPAYERGDFLIRGLLGADESRGALAIGDQVRVGQAVGFHVRGGESADQA